VFQHILLATDFSEASEGAFRVATALARTHAARLTVLYVYEVSAQTLAGTPEEEAERTWPGPIRVRELLDCLVTGLRATGLPTDGVIRFGRASRLIAEVARRTHEAGRHGRYRHPWPQRARAPLARQRCGRSPAPLQRTGPGRPDGEQQRDRDPVRSTSACRRSALAFTSKFMKPHTRKRGMS